MANKKPLCFLDGKINIFKAEDCCLFETSVSGSAGVYGLILYNPSNYNFINLWNLKADYFSLQAGDNLGYRHILLNPFGGYVGIGSQVVSWPGITFGGDSIQVVALERSSNSNGNILVVQAGGALVGGENLSGGNMLVSSGTSTGNKGSEIEFYTATPGASGTADRAPTKKGGISDIGLLYINDRVALTPEGGLAVKLTARATIAQGEVVTVATTNDDSVVLAPISGNQHDMPIGVAYHAAVSGNSIWVVTNGRCLVKPEDGITASRGYVIHTSSNTAGRVEQSAAPPANDHWGECGHWLANGSGNGALAYAIIHFN